MRYVHQITLNKRAFSSITRARARLVSFYIAVFSCVLNNRAGSRDSAVSLIKRIHFVSYEEFLPLIQV